MMLRQRVFQLTLPTAQPQGACMIIVFKNSTSTCDVYITINLGHPAGMSKGMRLYTGADSIKLICLSEAGERSILHGIQNLPHRKWSETSTTPVLLALLIVALF